MSNQSTARRLAALIEPDLRAAGVDLEDVEVLAAGKRRLVRVLVDKDDGVSLDDVALVSQRISGVLDENPDADAILGSAAYVLEVSSPGVDRPLTAPRHWRRAAGRLVRVVRIDGGEVVGRVVDSDDVSVRLADAAADNAAADNAAVPAGPGSLRFDEIKSARVQVEFNRPESSNVWANDVQPEESP
ncbi:MAG TPA: ribosome maturation factor RimP [Acidothermaceae bacterium]|nr:ribosome maturation factor RimP [Acidothermaceae bacterium]